MPHFSHLTLVLALSGLLTACASTDAAPGGMPVAPPAPASGVPAAPASAPAADAPADTGKVGTEPLLIRGNDRVVAPPPTAANAPARGASTSLKFESAPVAEVVRVMLGDLLKVDYVVHPPLNGTITLTTRQSVSPDRALLLLEAALQANGTVMARDSRGTYHVGAPESLKGIVSAPVLAEPGKPLPPGYGSVIIPLEYLGAGEMANILRPMVSSDAIVRVDSLRNLLVMRGTRAEAEGWLDLVRTFDVNLLRGMSVGVFPLKHTSAAEVDAALRLLSGGTASGAAGAAAVAGAAARAPAAPARSGAATAQAAQPAGQAAPAGLGEASPLFGALRVIPIERINAVLVVTPRAAYLEEARYWIEQFDRPNLNSAEPQLFVYKVQNGSADHLAELLNGIYGGTAQQPGFSGATGIAPGLTGVAGATPNVNSSFASRFGANRNTSLGSTGGLGASSGTLGGQGGIGGVGGIGGIGGAAGRQGQAQPQGPGVVTTTLGDNVRVMADRINNTLLIHAVPAEYERIAATLKRLDVQRAQILIEASIVEVTLGDGLEYGLQWTFNGGVGDGRSGRGVIGAAAAGGTLAADGSTAAGISNAFTYTLRNAAGNISAVLSALANKSLVKVMSSPSLMVLDNHTAAIQVGTQQPVNTGTTISGTNNFQTTNIQYKDTGVMLGVTPSVSAGDLVTLDIDQIVTDLGADSSSAQTAGYPTFLQRQINSKVAVRSGETLVLGGLIKDSASSSKGGVPLLSSIPVVGALFGRHRNTADRTELLVILTPRVLRSDEDARAVSRELRDRMQGLMQGGSLLPAPARP
ncbi:MAG: type II secretion system secretin GspD [Proteobacteria bacterium]|nr:type II secretion system secretin GspD [Pseudomonadota bacterium]